MYRRHILVAMLTFFLVPYMVLGTNVRITDELVGHLITFFSIVFGFYLTAFSALYGSRFVKRLGKEEDPIIKTKMKLQVLTKYLKISSIISILSIVSLLSVTLVGWVPLDFAKEAQCPNIVTGNYTIVEYMVCGKAIITSLVLGLSAVNIVFMSVLLKILLNAFLEEGTSK